LKAEKLRIREEKEKSLKDKAIREHVYGKYVLNVPNVKESERFQSIPRTESFSYPFNKADKAKLSSINYEQIEGQRNLSVHIGKSKLLDIVDEVSSMGSAITLTETSPLIARSTLHKSLDE